MGTPVPPAGAGAADLKAAARQAPVRRAPAAPPGQLDLIDRAQRLLITLTQGWQARRRVRVAGFSVFALVAFTVAFALASQGRCGPGCDAFGTGFSPIPTVAPASSLAPSTTGPKRSTTTTAAHPRDRRLRRDLGRRPGGHHHDHRAAGHDHHQEARHHPAGHHPPGDHPDVPADHRGAHHHRGADHNDRALGAGARALRHRGEGAYGE